LTDEDQRGAGKVCFASMHVKNCVQVSLEETCFFSYPHSKTLKTLFMKLVVTRQQHKASTLAGLLLGKQLMVMLTLFFLVASLSVSAQTNKVKGHITDEKGQPVANATISVKGTSSAVNSNDNGDFEISASPNATLVISYVGYFTKEVKVGSQTSLAVSLSASDKQLEQVVVVGYGTQRKRDVTGAVASVSGATLKEVPSPNLITQLKGRVAGVSIVSNGATPGSGGQIRIRGNRTITTSQSQSDAADAPLLVVDGVQFGGSINDLNPDDITNVEILKDASATAIYGSRGAGGVILITTKRGRTGKAIVSYDSYYGASEILGNYDVFSGSQYAQFKQDAATYNRTSPGTTSYPLTQAEKDALAAGISTNWQDLIYQRGFVMNQQLSVTGGSESTQFGIGGGYYREGGIIPNQKFERYTLRATIDHRISNRVKVGLNTLNTLSFINTPGGSGVPSNLVRTTPLAPPYNADGSVNLYPAIGSIDAAIYVNPLTLKTSSNAILSLTRRIRTFNSLYGEVQIAKGLRYRLNVGLDFSQSNGNDYAGPNTFVNSATVQTSSTAGLSNGEAWTYNIQNLLYYDKTFGDKHKLSLTGLFEVNKDHSQTARFTVTGVPADYIQNSNFALAAGTPVADPNNTSFAEQGLISYMGRANYSYANKYLLTATVRVDGSSTLSPGHQYFTYPAFGLGWNMFEEDFMKDLSVFSNLKLRGGWGISGNRNVAPYATLGLLSQSNYNFGQGTSGNALGYLVTSLPNYSLTWQSTAQWDVGLDFGLWKNRITGTLDVYQQNTKDILLPVQLPPSNGASSTLQNLGKTSGHGIELSLSALIMQKPSSFSWSVDLNYFMNREKITELQTPNQKFDLGNGWFVGQPLNVIYDYKKIGIWQTDDSTKGLISQTSPKQFPGQIRVQDVNGDGKIDAADRQVLGNFQPQWEGGITNRFSYKGFDLSVVIFARMGMKVLVPYLTADGGANGFPFFNQGRVNQIKINYWTRSNPTNDFPAPDAGTDRLNFGSTLGYWDGSFIKCRSINLGYEIPSKLTTKWHMNSLRIYGSVTNPFIIYSPLVSDGLAIDPEGNGYGNAVTATGSTGATATARQISVNLNNPSIRQFIIGLNLKF
jgi:TonB-linked SusC/RagA family outer membrane protein